MHGEPAGDETTGRAVPGRSFLAPVGAIGCEAGKTRKEDEMSSAQVQQIISQMGPAIGANSGLGGTLKFDFGDVGSVLIDGKSSPNTVTDGSGKNADCTIS